MTDALVGDELIAALLPAVADLVVAVHDRDKAAVAEAFAAAELIAADPLAAARALAVLAAGMASPNFSLADQLRWTLDDMEGSAA